MFAYERSVVVTDVTDRDCCIDSFELGLVPLLDEVGFLKVEAKRIARGPPISVYHFISYYGSLSEVLYSCALMVTTCCRILSLESLRGGHRLGKHKVCV
jgi:hypothetical protein